MLRLAVSCRFIILGVSVLVGVELIGYWGAVFAIPVAASLKVLVTAAWQESHSGGVFLDPPYGEGWVDKILGLLARSPTLEPDAWVVVEHSQHEEGAEAHPPLALTDRRRYGTTGVSFYQRQGEEAA